MLANLPICPLEAHSSLVVAPTTRFGRPVAKFRPAKPKNLNADSGYEISGLAFGGFRKAEAKHVTWADCNFEKKEITVRGDLRRERKMVKFAACR